MTIPIRVFVILTVLLVCSSTAFARLGFFGYLNYATEEEFEDDERISSTDTYSRNLLFDLDKEVNRFLSYDILFRTVSTDTSVSDPDDGTSTSYLRLLEPEIGINLANPMYTLGVGYRLQERWNSKTFEDESRITNDFVYARFSLLTRELPTLNLDFQNERTFDHKAVSTTDIVRKRYNANSAYSAAYRDLKLKLSFNFLRDIDETPLSSLSQTLRDQYSGQYELGYNRSFWDRYSFLAAYQGNYQLTVTERTIEDAGFVLLQRQPLGGLHAQGTAIQPDVDFLPPLGALIDSNVVAGIPSINIGTELYHNTGIFVSSRKPVDRLYVYVNQDVTGDSSLTNVSNWKVYKSDTNLPATIWDEIALGGVSVSQFDVVNNIYRYEIRFLTPQSASFFKAVNMDVVVATGLTNVLVTEIEAWGEDSVTDIEKEEQDSFRQQLRFRARAQWAQWLLSLAYSIERTDQNRSVEDSLSGLLESIGTKETDGDEDTQTIRNYRATINWQAHRLFRMDLRLLRNETFNTTGTDIASNTYTTQFGSQFLPTLETAITLSQRDRFDADDKTVTSRTAVLTVMSELWRNIDFTADTGYQTAENFERDSETSGIFINGTLKAVISRDMFANVVFGSAWTDSDGESSRSSSGRASLSYRPGRFINMSLFYRLADNNGDVTTSQTLSVDWRPIPVIRLDLNYRRTSFPDDRERNSIQSNVTWAIKRFLSLRVTHAYNQNKEARNFETNAWRFTLTGTF